MTTWGCTPLCRGFDRHGGFYNAFNDYYSYKVGDGLDLRLDFAPDNATAAARPYSSDLYATRAIDWITGAVGAGAQNSFGYLAFQAIHAPQEAPADLVLQGFCADSIPASAPVRRVACGQMRSVDANVARVIAAYKALGIWEQTLVRALFACPGQRSVTLRRGARISPFPFPPFFFPPLSPPLKKGDSHSGQWREHGHWGLQLPSAWRQGHHV